MRQSRQSAEALAPLPTRRPLWAGGTGRTNRMATASLVLGLLWLGGVGSVAAVLCGHRGQRQIHGHWQRGMARATLGIRLGWVGIVATGVLAVLMMFTPEQLAYRWDQIQRMMATFFDGRSSF